MATANKTIEVTASMIRAYKSCRRLYELEYVECLKPVAPYEPFVTGSSYHDKLEQIIKTGDFKRTGDVTDIFAEAWKSNVYSQLEFKSAEDEFKIHLAHGIYAKGKIDATLVDGTPVEHKTSGVAPDEKYVYGLNWDDQVSLYMLSRGVTKMIYTVCQKPKLRQKKNETEEEFLKRIGEWFKEDPNRCRFFTVVRTEEELEEKRKEIISIAKEMRSQKFFFTNPGNCKILGCQYRDICLDYDPQYLVGYEKKSSINEELTI